MPLLTRMPAVIPALVDVFTEALAGATIPVVVVDGPQMGEPPLRAVVVGIGWRGQPPYSTTVTRQPGMKTSLREDWSVTCFATVQLTGDAFPAARLEVAALLASLDQGLRAHGVTDAWEAVTISGQVEWVPELTSMGAACSLVFNVNGAGLL